MKATVEDMREERGTVESTKKNGYTSSSSSSSNSSNSSMGGKLLKVFKRKVHSPNGSGRASQDERTSVHDAAKEDSRGRNNRTQVVGIVPAWRGQSTVDTLEDELLRLRRRLELREAEMQKLKSEVSTLRKASANGSVQPSEHLALTSVPHKETSQLVTSSESFRSDASQLSCLDFSLAETGKLKFEGKIKTKITHVSVPGVNGEDETDSILLDTAAKHVEISRKYCHDLAEGFKVPETAKGDLDISAQSYVSEREDSECFDFDANSSQSPLKSCTEDQDFTFPTLVPWTPSDSADSFVLHKEALSMFSVHEIRDHVDVDEKHLEGPLSTQEEFSFKEVASSKATRLRTEVPLTIEIPPATEDPLQMHMKSCVMHEVDKLSKAMKSLQREESLTSSKYPDRISRSTPLLPLPRPPTAPAAEAAAQSPPHGGAQVPRRGLEWQLKALTVAEQPRPVTTARKWHEKDLELRIEEATEQVAGPNRSNSEDLPQTRGHRTNSFGTSSLTSPQSRDRATKTAECRHEGLSPSSSPTSPNARDLFPSKDSVRDEPARKPQLGSGERVWQILSSALSGEHSGEEVDVEEEVRQCLEQSRMLLMSDATSTRTSTEDKQSILRPTSRETSFSVLALSRHRRSMDKNNTSPRSRPEMHQQQQQQQGWLEPQEVVSHRYVDHTKLNAQFGEVDINYPAVEAKEENDLDYVFSRPSSLGISADKNYAQLSYESKAWESTFRSPPSLSSRRSRFFTEANSPRFSQAA